MKKNYFVLLAIAIISCSENSGTNDQNLKSNNQIDPITKYDKTLEEKGIKLLWNTAKTINNTELIELNYFDHEQIINPSLTKNLKTMGKSTVLISENKLSIIFYIPSETSKVNIKKLNISNYVLLKFDGEIIIEDLLSTKMSKLKLNDGSIISTTKFKKVTRSSTSKLVWKELCISGYVTEYSNSSGEYEQTYSDTAFCHYEWVEDGDATTPGGGGADPSPSNPNPGTLPGNNANMSGTTISYQPYYSYESGLDIENFYPNMTNQFRASLPKLGDNLYFTEQLSNLTSIDIQTITNKLYYGSGPHIIIDQLDNIYSSTTVYVFDGSYLYIDLDYAITFNNSGALSSKAAKIFFALVTLQDGVNLNFSNRLGQTITSVEGHRIAVDSYGNLTCTMN